jgi:hypothetical protein
MINGICRLATGVSGVTYSKICVVPRKVAGRHSPASRLPQPGRFSTLAGNIGVWAIGADVTVSCGLGGMGNRVAPGS